MKNSKGHIQSGSQKENTRQIDALFNKYAEIHQHPINKLIHWICVPMIVFSLFGLVWAIPFLYLDFMGRYNGFVNWASFLIAFSIYYYYTLSPVLSYVMLLVVFVFSGVIVGLEKAQEYGWPPMWHICLVIFVLAWVGQFVGHKIEGKKPSFLHDLQFLLIGPIWLLHFLLKKIGLRY